MSFDTRVLTGVGMLAAITEAGSFARAMETLGLTPSGVSRAVARLEGRVGVRLFDRTPHCGLDSNLQSDPDHRDPQGCCSPSERRAGGPSNAVADIKGGTEGKQR
jgi:Bacterial regulatory helix-turn-helix protein, lysR family